ncbi:MAG TPA: class I SAM-dependent methyltransferase [Thermoanaerobaculia bacterium]
MTAGNWSDDDSLWAAMTPALASPLRFAAAQCDVAMIAGAVALPAAASVLDLGCGAGVHSIAFAARGYAVTAVDRSATLLAIARRHAIDAGNLEFVHADMRDFVRPRAFDLVCSLCASLCYFDDDTHVRILRNIHESLRSGGTLVLDVISRANLECHWEPRAAFDVDRTHYEVERAVDADWSHVRETWTVFGKSFQTAQRLYSAAEMTQLLNEAGFTNVEIAGSLDKTLPHGPDAHRMIAFALR